MASVPWKVLTPGPPTPASADPPAPRLLWGTGTWETLEVERKSSSCSAELHSRVTSMRYCSPSDDAPWLCPLA
eukprot:198338-Rhodomonas_salina.1